MATIFDFCILQKMPKGATVSPGGILLWGVQWTWISKKTSCGRQCTLHPPDCRTIRDIAYRSFALRIRTNNLSNRNKFPCRSTRLVKKLSWNSNLTCDWSVKMFFGNFFPIHPAKDPLLGTLMRRVDLDAVIHNNALFDTYLDYNTYLDRCDAFQAAFARLWKIRS